MLNMPNMSSMISSTCNSIVLNGLQSCLEQQQIVQHLKLKLQNFDSSHCDDDGSDDKESKNYGEWSCLYSLNTIVDPSMNSVESLHASKNNLELCTETLGCETGVKYSISDYNRDIMLSSPIKQEQENNEAMQWCNKVKKRRQSSKHTVEFPPPLTTLTGEFRHRMMSHRVNGRLLLIPVKPNVILKAERKYGRLCLKLESNNLMSTTQNDDNGHKLISELVDHDECCYNGMYRSWSARRCKEEEEENVSEHEIQSNNSCMRSKRMLQWDAKAFLVASS